jgi:hypothetical protein
MPVEPPTLPRHTSMWLVVRPAYFAVTSDTTSSIFDAVLGFWAADSTIVRASHSLFGWGSWKVSDMLC